MEYATPFINDFALGGAVRNLLLPNRSEDGIEVALSCQVG